MRHWGPDAKMRKGGTSRTEVSRVIQQRYQRGGGGICPKARKRACIPVGIPHILNAGAAPLRRNRENSTL